MPGPLLATHGRPTSGPSSTGTIMNNLSATLLRALLLAWMAAPAACVTTIETTEVLSGSASPPSGPQEASSPALVILASQIPGTPPEVDPNTFTVLVADRPHTCSDAFDWAPNCSGGSRWQVQVDVPPGLQNLGDAVGFAAPGVSANYIVSDGDTDEACGLGAGCIKKGTLEFLSIGDTTVELRLSGIPEDYGVSFEADGQYTALRCP